LAGRGPGEGVDTGYLLGPYRTGEVREELLRIPLGELNANILTVPNGRFSRERSVCVARSNSLFRFRGEDSARWLVFRASLKILGAEWAGHGSSKAAGYAEENSAEMGMGGQIRNPG